MRRVVDVELLPVRLVHEVGDGGRRRDDVQPELALDALLNDLHVQKPQEPAAKPEPERDGCIRLEDERRVVELQFQKRVFEVVELAPVERVNAAEHDGLHLLVAGERLGGGIARVGERVADGDVLNALDARSDVADLARVQAVLGQKFGVEGPHFGDFILLVRAERPDEVAHFHAAVLDAHEQDDALVVVVIAVEDERFEGRLGISVRGRDVGDDLFEDVADVGPLLRGDAGRVGSVEADDVLDLLLRPLDVRRGEVDLVDDGDDLEVVFEGEVDVGERLRLDALRRIDDEDGALARGERAGDLVGEVDVAGGVDEVELVLLPVFGGVVHAHGRELDGDAALALEIHGVQKLVLHVARGDLPRQLHQPVGDRALAVVDVRYDTKIADGLVRFRHEMLR